MDAIVDISVTRSIAHKLLVLVGVALLAGNVCAQEIICYTDLNGSRRCGDRVPPEDSRQDRTILNNQGIVIRQEQGEITDDEREAMEKESRSQAALQLEADERARYGQVLLESYSSVENIEALRDRMLEQIDGQISIMELYLTNLHRTLNDLTQKTHRYAPLSDRENAPPVPKNLALDIEATKSSIEMFKRRLDESRVEKENTKENFERDIAYFKQPKGGGV